MTAHAGTTQCPHCHTVFWVSKAQLRMSKGSVRCGICLSVFSAHKPNHAISEQNALIDPIPPSGEYAAYVTDTTGRPERPLSHPPTKTPLQNLQTKTPKPDQKGRYAWLLSNMVILFVMGAWLIWLNSERLAQNAVLQSWYQALCPIMGCKLPIVTKSLVRVPSIEVHKIRRRSTGTPSVTTLDTIIENHTKPQPFPVIRLRFSDAYGQIVDERTFQPTQYLPPNTKALMPTDTPIYLSLKTTGVKPFSGYQIAFFTSAR